MLNARDPLLAKICDRIIDLQAPAFVKGSDLRFVIVNAAFCDLFDVTSDELIGATGKAAGLDRGLDLQDRERACVVFGDDQQSQYLDPAGKGHYRVDLERFTLADGGAYIYGVFNRLDDAKPAPEAAHAADGSQQAAEPASEGTSQGLDLNQVDSILNLLDVGVGIWSRDDVLLYANDRLRAQYRQEGVRIEDGISFVELTYQFYDIFSQHSPETYPPDPDARDAWVRTRHDWHQKAVAADQVMFPSGRSLQMINRRLADGSLIGLRIDATEIKAREDLLDKHVQEIGVYRELLDMLPVAAFARGVDYRLEFVNRAFADLLGRNASELIGTTEYDIYDTPQADEIRGNNEMTLRGEMVAHEIDLRITEGHVPRVMATTRQMSTERGLKYLVGTIVDVSPLRQREILLEEANSKAEEVVKDFGDIISSIDVGVLVLDENLTIQVMNEAYYNHLWRSQSEAWLRSFIGRPFRELLEISFEMDIARRVSPNRDEYCDTRIREILDGPIQPREIVLHDGMICLYSSIKLSRGRYLLTYFDLSDIRQRDKEIAEARRETDEAYRLIKNATDTMPQGVAVVEHGRTVFANQAFSELFGVPLDMMTSGAPWEEIYDLFMGEVAGAARDDLDQKHGLIKAAMERGIDVNERIKLPSGRTVLVEMRCREDGQRVFLFSDQTAAVEREMELERLVAKAEAADQAKSEFLANIGVEFRTPLNGILGMAELLAKTPMDTRQRAFIEIIQKSGSALLSIINDIIEFSKLDSGHVQLKYQAFSAAEALEDVATIYASRAAEKDLELIVERKGDIPAKIMGDAGRFRQIVTNLVSNAIHFTEHGHVHVTIEAMPDGQGRVILQVRVEDTGVGIPDDKLSRIFDKFSQIDLSISRNEGSGLGLAIAQRLAHIQGGTITVHSSEGVGSQFAFALPAQVAVESRREEPLPLNVAGARILVIDDHEQARALMCDNIAGWGFDCVGAESAAAGVEILRAAHASGLAVNALVVDEAMPGESGGDLVSRLRADPAFAHVPVIMLASAELSGASVAYVAAEAYMPKPVRMQTLKSTLIDVIRAARASAAKRCEGHAETIVSDAADRPQRPYALVAEDNEVNQIFFRQIFAEAGIECRIIGNGFDVLQLCAERRPALLILDISPPGLDGFECARRLRADETDRMPIIGVVSHNDEADIAACLDAGMDDTITKPVTPERVEDKIRIWSPLLFPQTDLNDDRQHHGATEWRLPG